MTLPLLGTVDLTPSGLFLIFAVVVAVGYLVWQVVNARKVVARDAGARDASAAADGDAPGEADQTDTAN